MMKNVILFLTFYLGRAVLATPVSQFNDDRLEAALSLQDAVQLELDETGRNRPINSNEHSWFCASDDFKENMILSCKEVSWCQKGDQNVLLRKMQLNSSRMKCIFVKSEEGLYSFSSPGTGEQVCGLYIIAEPDKQVEFEFQSFDISCTKGGLLSVIDGWELNGQFFPSPEDHPIPAEKRFIEFCGKTKPRKLFKTSQNVGLLEFRVPTKGQGYTVSVKFHSNPKPCNAVLQEPQGTYTLRNYNRKSNCSISVIFPLSVKVLAASIGVQSGWPKQTLDFETGLLSKCRKRGFHDFVEIRGGDGLDPNLMKVAVDFCGMKSMPREPPVTIACGNTAVRLVSSGDYENSITFSFDIPSDFSSLDLVCPSFLAAF